MKLKDLLIECVNFYQKYISPFLAPRCVFYPTCSDYAKQALKKYGALKGLRLGLWRILRCHPYQKNQIDPLL